jgi:hypothetical protein
VLAEVVILSWPVLCGTSGFRGLPCTLKVLQILRIDCTMIIRPVYVWTASVCAQTLEWHIESENDNSSADQKWNSFKMRSIQTQEAEIPNFLKSDLRRTD